MFFESQDAYMRSPIFQLIRRTAIEEAEVCECGEVATQVDCWFDQPIVPVDEKQRGRFPASVSFPVPSKLRAVCAACYRRISEARAGVSR